MRENIGLYKAKRKDNGEWVEGYYLFVKEQNKHYILTGKTRSYPIDLAHPHLTLKGFEWLEIDQETLCECTGLKDKNGKLIWENDIVESVSWNEYLGNDINLESLKRKLLVKYINGQLCLFEKFKDEKDMIWDWSNRDKDTFEIIGNKFDNKELLGE